MTTSNAWQATGSRHLRRLLAHPRLPGFAASRAFAVLPAFAALLAFASAPAAHARAHKHKTKAVVDRIAQGEVVNGDGKPLDGAVVYLEDPTSLAIKSYLSTGGGHFHFDHLANETDYEIWAEQNGVESKHKFISQFNSKNKFDYTLTVTTGKKHKLLGFL